MTERPWKESEATRGHRKVLLPDRFGYILEFLEGEERGRKVPIFFNRTVLGRRVADILVSDLNVSGTHAALSIQGTSIQVIDLGSANGTFVGGKRVGSAPVELGDRIRIGGTVFCLNQNPEEHRRLKALYPAMPAPDAGLAQLIDREFFGTSRGSDDVTASIRAEPEGERVVAIEVSAGPDQGKRFALKKAQIVIGRIHADIELHDKDVSRKHALLERQEGGQILIRDLASTNGTLVNGRKVSNCVLNPGDTIRVGQTTLVYREETVS